MVVKFEEFDDIAASQREASLALVFEDGEAGDGEVNGGFELGGFEFPAEERIELPSDSSHVCLIFSEEDDKYE